MRTSRRTNLGWGCAFIAALVACAGANSGRAIAPVAPNGPTPQVLYTAGPPNVQIAEATFPTPFDPDRSLSDLGTTDLINQRSLAQLRARKTSLLVKSTTEHEAVGVLLYGTSPPYNGFFGLQSAYEAQQLPFPFPQGASGLEVVYAPTMHMGWGGCLENSSAYVTSAASQRAYFTVFNLCAAAGQGAFIFQADNRFAIHIGIRKGTTRPTTKLR